MGIPHIHTTINYEKLIEFQANSSIAKINKKNKYGRVSDAKQENYPAKVRKLGILGKKGRR